MDKFLDACIKGEIDTVKRLMNKVDITANSNLGIRYAIIYNHLEIVKLLLSNPCVNPSVFDNRGIKHACFYGDFEMIELLLSDFRVNSTLDYDYAIKLASEIKHFDIIKLLLEYQYKVDNQKYLEMAKL